MTVGRLADKLLGPRRDDPVVARDVAAVQRLHQAIAEGRDVTEAEEDGALIATLGLGKGVARQVAREVHER